MAYSASDGSEHSHDPRARGGSVGELCCDYGSGKVCQLARDCPVFCASDTMCQTSIGQACVVTSLASGAQAACNDVGAGLQFCQSSGDCRGSQTCCTNYDRPICTDALQCPAACTADSQCNTLDGELCCTTVQAVEPSLSASGLCLNPTFQACPKACTSSAECVQTPGSPICCNGLCSATCATTCTQDSDCYDQICCKAPTVALPSPPVLFAVTPTCSGATLDSTCASCFEDLQACTCPGCSIDTGAGNCVGTATASTCDECESQFACNADECPDCVAGSIPGCSGSPEFSTCAACPTELCLEVSTYCPGCGQIAGPCEGTLPACLTIGDRYGETVCTDAGCTWGTTGCSGTPSSCADFTTQGSCEVTEYCSWPVVCTGTLTSCSANTTETECASESGCFWDAPTCAGTVTPCTSLTDRPSCVDQPGCAWNAGGAGACVGQPTPCADLSILAGDGGVAPCRLQPGCFVPRLDAGAAPVADDATDASETAGD